MNMKVAKRASARTKTATQKPPSPAAETVTLALNIENAVKPIEAAVRQFELASKARACAHLAHSIEMLSEASLLLARTVTGGAR